MRYSQAAGLIEAQSRSIEIAREYPHATVEPIHLLKALLVPDDGPTVRLTQLLGLNVHEIRARVDAALMDMRVAPHSREVPRPSSALQSVLQAAETECQTLDDRQVDEFHALLVLSGPDGLLPGDLRRELGYGRRALLDAKKKLDSALSLTASDIAGGVRSVAGAGGGAGAFEYCEDLTARAQKGELDPVLGRGREIARMTEILARRRKNNPLITGSPGVGKTALVEGLAHAIASGVVVDHLKKTRIYALDLAGLVAGAKYKGEFEERFKKLLGELARRREDAILFVDEIHALLGVGRGGGGIDAANMLKPALARGEIRLIGATTTAEYREHIEKDPAFARRFVPLPVEEPDDETTRAILSGLSPHYARHHGVEILPDALDAAIKLSRRYLTSRFLPDKAVDLLDEAAADVQILACAARAVGESARTPDADAHAEAERRFREALADRSLPAPEAEGATVQDLAERYSRRVVDRDVVARRVSIASGVPVAKLGRSERERLVGLEAHLHKRVIGQDQPIRAVANAIRRSRTGLKQRPAQPIGSFLFLGPTGTGKTELAKALAEFLFDDERALIRIDMTEYGEKHTVQRLVGSPPGYVGHEEGGALTEALRRRPYSVVLFDEIDKAHPNCLDILIPLLDDGRLTDGKSNTVDCSNTVVILTSNFAGPWIAAELRSKGQLDRADLVRRLLQPGPDPTHDRGGFRPELLNRFDDFQTFHPLDEGQVAQIVGLQVDRLVRTVAEQGVTLEVTAAAREIIAREGYDPDMGARPVRRVIDRRIGDPLALALAGAEQIDGAIARVAVEAGEIKVDVSWQTNTAA